MSITVVHNEYHERCRVCLKIGKSGELQSLFNDKIENILIAEAIMACASVQIIQTDDLPSQICKNCLIMLNEAYIFRQICEKSDHLLKNISLADHSLDEELPNKLFDDEVQTWKFQSPKSILFNTNNDIAKPEMNLQKRDLIRKKRKRLAVKERFEKENYQSNPCEYCNKLIPSSKINTHMRTHLNKRTYVCDICGKMVLWKSNLQRHLLNHAQEPKTERKRSIKCAVCNQGFTDENNLSTHMQVHTNQAPFQCEICHKGFLSKGNFNRHKLIHGERKFHCNNCGKGFKSESQLKFHGKIHLETKPYQCAICDKSFSYLDALKVHTRVHTGEKPFSCHICGKLFKQSQHLSTHMRIHTGEKPYKCSVCQTGFAANCNLTVHMRLHSGEMPYLCPTCGKGYHNSSSMKRHYQKHFS